KMVNATTAKEILRCQILWLVTAKDVVIIINHVLKSCMSYNEDPIVYRIHTTYTAGSSIPK
ncbi:MAG: hypothetical protein WB587_10455, partial [Nitrososphaeraceae archaeon]